MKTIMKKVLCVYQHFTKETQPNLTQYNFTKLTLFWVIQETIFAKI